MDYCTFWFEGWWAHCCEAHDEDYLLQIGQALADEKLFQCVVATGTNPLMGIAAGILGTTMYVGVKLFGKHFYKRPIRVPRLNNARNKRTNLAC